jgi:ABC-2 type transport system permease protein
VGVVIFALAVSNAPVDWTAAKVLYLPLVVAGMVTFFGGLFVIGGTITLWTVESVQAINIFTYGGSTLMSYPMNIYHETLRRVFTYVVPAAFLNYYPALWFLGKPDPFGLPAAAPFVAPLVGVAVLSAALAFWRFGLRHYRSTGT